MPNHATRAIIITIVILAAILILAARFAAMRGHLDNKASKIAVVVIVVAGAIVMLYPFLGLR